jgi:hypothetical protein
MEKKVYVVVSYGGQYEDKWDKNEAVFFTKEKAEKYISDMERENSKISEKKLCEVYDFISDYELENIFDKYYYYDGKNESHLREGYTDEEYYKEYDEFYENGIYKLIEEKFGFTKEEWDNATHRRDYDFCGYYIDEIPLFEE